MLGSMDVGFVSTLLAWLNVSNVGPAVVRAHAARADAAERQARHREVEDRRVHAHAAGRGAVDDVVRDVGVFGEHVQRQRLLARVDEVDCRVDVVDRDQREDRPEDLLLHDRRGRIRAPHRGRCEVAVGFVALAAVDHLTGALVVEQPGQAGEVAVVDDASVVRHWCGVVAVELAHRVAQAGGQRTLDPPVDEHVVGRDAGLARVDVLAPRDAPRGDVEVGAAVDDGRALAAELERHRREVLRGGGHHHPTDGAVAGVEDVVPALVEQRGGLGHAAFDHGDRVGVEVARHEAGQRAKRCGPPPRTA